MSAIALENLRKDFELGPQTDARVSVAWVFLPILAIVLSVVVAAAYVAATIAAFNRTATPPTQEMIAPFFGGFAVAIGISVVAEVLFLYFFYLLIRRRNQHFPRQQRFFNDLTTVLRAAASRRNVDVGPMLGSIESSVRYAQVEEAEKSAVLWVILLLVPFVNLIAELYILYFLTNDFYRHERREDGMLSDVERALAPMGVQFIFHRNGPIPHRSFVLYVVVTIITFGIFGIYWEYVLIKDPNDHFANHAVYEPEILQLLAPMVA